MLHPNSKDVGFFVSCEYEYPTPSIVAMSDVELCRFDGMLDIAK